MTTLHLHRGRTALPMWAPVDTHGHLTFDPGLRTARELMAARDLPEDFVESWLRQPSNEPVLREIPIAS